MRMFMKLATITMALALGVNAYAVTNQFRGVTSETISFRMYLRFPEFR